MGRRGLVSKSLGGPQGSGGAALMPKGDKPKGPELLALAEVARKLGVEPQQVEAWVKKDKIRGTDAGIRPYDFKKFQLDCADDIRRAQQEAAEQRNKNRTERKPKKGIFSKFRAIFGGSDKSSGNSAGQGNLAAENRKLRAELKALKKEPEEDQSELREMEEKLRFLENKLSKNVQMEAELKRLRDRDGNSENSGSSGQEEQQLRKQLEQARRQLAESQKLHSALAESQQEKEELQSRVEELLGRPSTVDSSQLNALRVTLQQREKALTELVERSTQMEEENRQLKRELENGSRLPESAPDSGHSKLAAELLEIQRLNLVRFKTLHKSYQETSLKLSNSQEFETLASKRDSELKELEAKFQKLKELSREKDSGESELVKLLSQSREKVKNLAQENEKLKAEILNPSSDDSSRIDELEKQLKDAQKSSEQVHSLESELKTLQKNIQSREQQVQKVAGRLEDNEKRLSKALQESARLTELLIERENRLRDLSAEFEQEYRDKMENLEKQVSGLQWKLSIREERIADLESELQRNK